MRQDLEVEKMPLYPEIVTWLNLINSVGQVTKVEIEASEA